MPGIKTMVELKTVMHTPVVVGNTRLHPESQVVLLRLPFGGYRSFWARPTAVTLERAGQAADRLPILDQARLRAAGIVLGGVVLSGLWLIARSRRQQES